jgi:hypothetical protein
MSRHAITESTERASEADDDFASEKSTEADQSFYRYIDFFLRFVKSEMELMKNRSAAMDSFLTK